jgi:FkbM family methyltransferase
MFLYKLVDKFLMRDLCKEIIENLKTKEPIIFDIGCFIGNFSNKLKKDLNLPNKNFYLFDANPNLKIKNFKYYNEVFSNKVQIKNFHLNEFFPASGSGLKVDTKNDMIWNFTRKLATLSFGKSFKSFKVKTNTLDKFCKKKKIKKIDILKIDVEGGEFEVLEGGKDILKRTYIIQVEIYQNKKNFNKIEKKVTKFLERYNFKKIHEKKIWSVSILSNLRGKDLLFKKII